MIRSADWYFDFVSPYSYLQFKHFHRLPASLKINLVPVLFAGLLNHWGHKGPAEIPSKRVEMYRYCHWYASRLGVPFRTPPAHPFNPLKVLRLTIALGADQKTVETVFDHIWGQGHDIHTEDGFASLVARLDVADVDELPWRAILHEEVIGSGAEQGFVKLYGPRHVFGFVVDMVQAVAWH